MRYAQRKSRLLVLGAMAIAAFISVGLLVAAHGDADEATDISALPVLDGFNRTESPLSLSGNWAPLKWDTSASGHNTGAVTTEGWRVLDASPTINGAYWAAKSFKDEGNGDAVSMKMVTAPASENRYLSLWLNMPSPSTAKTGYELKWTWATGAENPGNYDIKLSKWTAGTETVLASKTAQPFSTGTNFALSYKGGTVTAWSGTEASIHSVLTASDSTYSSGYAGMDGVGNISRSVNFRAGALAAVPVGTCKPSRQFFAGACWDNLMSELPTTAPKAAAKCAVAGGELPSALTLAAFSEQTGIFLNPEGEWTDDVLSFSGPNAYALATVNSTGVVNSKVSTNTAFYRCVYPEES